MRAVIDQRLVPEHKAVIKQFEEDPLRPSVIVILGCVHCPGPVERETDASELVRELLDIGVRDHPGVRIGLNGIVLGGQAESVVADREQDIVALHPALSRKHFHTAVRLDMADVHAGSAGIGELHKAVEFRLVAEILRLKELGIFPLLLPLGFNLLKIVFHETQLL